MGTRIYTLMDLFDLSERFCDTKEKQCEEYIMSRKCIDYVKSFPKFDVMKKFSEDFLNEILGEELNKVAKTN